ncbi:hypothetical protein D0B54_06765 [Solimonas sp. K1W22B-7]|uniref:hypothetical protein n=1 Tax=Solimonas sp. K1W22B-7 TaxID=2303331 RepID=UPI000E331323|nr:hypothetical protein [Solimonas sp. K1W22B-7]AXQ28401.1 hypothetical protein D0B54_06765 [Solimonas sp. K1W22B-7]
MDEYLEPTPAGRRLGIVLIGALIVLGAILKFWAEPALFGHISSLPLCQQMRWYRDLLQWLGLALALLSIWPILTLVRVIAIGQAPPPGTWVLHRTRIRRGWTARAGSAGALLLLALVVCWGYDGWQIVQDMLDTALTKCAAKAS